MAVKKRPKADFLRNGVLTLYQLKFRHYFQ